MTKANVKVWLRTAKYTLDLTSKRPYREGEGPSWSWLFRKRTKLQRRHVFNQLAAAFGFGEEKSNLSPISQIAVGDETALLREKPCL